MRENIANMHSALLKYVDQDPLLKGLENQQAETCINLLKYGAIISGNTDLFPGVPGRRFFVTLDVAVIASAKSGPGACRMAVATEIGETKQ